MNETRKTAVRSRVQEIRQARGVSAAALARDAGVSRQTIYSIEDGTFVPNTAVALRLARALAVPVEELFALEDRDESASIPAELLPVAEGVNEGQLVRVCRVNERIVAIPPAQAPAYLPAADGVVARKSGKTVSVRTWSERPGNGKQVLVAGCDPALSTLGEMLSGSGMEVINVPVASRRALAWLKEGKIHAAGCHLRDKATGDYNVPLIRRLMPGDAVRVVTFATWEQGLVVRHGNPKSIRSVADLSGRGVRLVNREKGSGSRDLLDTGLRQAGVAPERVAGYERTADGHLAAAREVAEGNADCCVATRSAARCFGLDFIPLAVERFDLAFAHASLELPATKALLDVLNGASLRRKLEVIAGYDTAHTGEIRG